MRASDEHGRGFLVVLHTPNGRDIGARIAIDASPFTIGTRAHDLTVEGALETATSAELLWEQDSGAGTQGFWCVRGAGRLAVNGQATTVRHIVAGDELRVVDSFFRFIAGDAAQQLFYHTIYQLTVVDFSSGAHRYVYLDEVVRREQVKAAQEATSSSVAIVRVEAAAGPEDSDVDALRTLVDALKSDGGSQWTIGRTGKWELGIAALETASVLRTGLVMVLGQRRLDGVRLYLGVAAHHEGWDPRALFDHARATATVL